MDKEKEFTEAFLSLLSKYNEGISAERLGELVAKVIDPGVNSLFDIHGFLDFLKGFKEVMA